MSSRQLEDQMEQAATAKIAEVLEISVEDVEQYVEIDEQDNGTGVIVNFHPSTPLSVREAAGAGDGFTLNLGPNAFGFDDEQDEYQ